MTGSNTGIGFHTALDLAAKQYRVILACRSAARGADAAAAIVAKCPSAIVKPMELDVGRFESVVSFADLVRSEIGPVACLVLNAGIGGMGWVPEPTEDGADRLYRVNFVGHFLLTILLESCLAAGGAAAGGAPARVVCLSSVMHRNADGKDWLCVNRIPPCAPAHLPALLPCLLDTCSHSRAPLRFLFSQAATALLAGTADVRHVQARDGRLCRRDHTPLGCARPAHPRRTCVWLELCRRAPPPTAASVANAAVATDMPRLFERVTGRSPSAPAP